MRVSSESDRQTNHLQRDALLAVGVNTVTCLKITPLKPVSQMDLRWQTVDKQSGLCTKNLRLLATALDFASSSASGRVWLAALEWMKGIFARQQRLAKQPLEDIPQRTIPTRLRNSLLSFDQEGKPTGLRGDRYEFWVYRQLRKRLDAGDIYLDDSVRHRRFSDDLVSMEAKADALQALVIPWLRQPIDVTLVWAGGTAPGAGQRQGVGLAQADHTGGVAAPALPWALCV